MEVAVALGCDPVTTYAGSAPLPKHIDEIMVPGFLRGEPVELVQCRTVDLQVPARAEIVIEGYCERGELRARGPVRRPHRLLHAGRAVPGAERHRDDHAARRDLPVDRGRRRRRWRTSGSARRPSASSCRRSARRCPRSWTTTCRSPARSTTAASSRSARPTPATRARSCTRSGAPACSSLTKAVVVVDEHVDVHDYNAGHVAARGQRRLARDVARSSGPLDQLDHAAQTCCARRQARHRRNRHLGRRGLPARVARDRAHERGRRAAGRRALARAGDPARRGTTAQRPRTATAGPRAGGPLPWRR